MIPIYTDFDYPILERDTKKSGERIYKTPDSEYLPSVTTILSATKDTAILDAWRERVGEQEAARQVRDASNIGAIMHESLEEWIQTGNFLSGTNFIHKMAYKMARNIIDNGLCKVDKVYGLEKHLYFSGLYAGTVDLVASFENELTIVDFKNSKYIKKEEWIDDYYCQCVAYALAHNNMFGTKIRKACIMMSDRADLNRNLSYKSFILEGNKFDEFKIKWLRVLDQYYTDK